MELLQLATLSHGLDVISGVEEGLSNSKRGVERYGVLSVEVIEFYLLIHERLSFFPYLVQVAKVGHALGKALGKAKLGPDFDGHEGQHGSLVVLNPTRSRHVVVVAQEVLVVRGGTGVRIKTYVVKVFFF